MSMLYTIIKFNTTKIVKYKIKTLQKEKLKMERKTPWIFQWTKEITNMIAQRTYEKINQAPLKVFIQETIIKFNTNRTQQIRKCHLRGN